MRIRPLTIVLFVILGFVVLSGIGNFLPRHRRARTPPSASRPARKMTRLKAYVSFDGWRFEVMNLDDFTWHVPKFTINAEIVDDPYVYQERYFIAGIETKIYPARDFANSKGQRFNPWTMKPLNFTIECDLSAPHDRGHWFSKLKSTGR